MIEKIKAIQRILEVEDDGIWGKKSQAALDEALAKPKPVVVIGGELVDERSERSIDTLHPKVRPLARQLVRNASAVGITIKVISGTRTYDEQNDLYEQGRSKPGRIVTNARAGYSNHNFGIAFDIGVFDGGRYFDESPKYETVGQLGKELGLTWGGDWKSIQDEPHFELHPAWAAGDSESAMLTELRFRRTAGKDAFA